MRGDDVAPHPSLRDLVTILYRPRETLRRILDGGHPRWWWEVIALASICSSFVDPDIRRAAASLDLTAILAVAVFGVIVNAFVWVLAALLFAWAATYVARWLDGEGTFRDMRAAVAWGLVPQIWSIVYRVPLSYYVTKYVATPGDERRALLDFVREGGCSVVIVLITVQMLFYALMAWVESCCVGEAMHFSSWRGFGTIAITGVIPVVIALAAVFAAHS